MKTTDKKRSNGSERIGVLPSLATVGLVRTVTEDEKKMTANLPAGSVLTINDEDAAEAFKLNRNLVHAQNILRAEHERLMIFAQTLAPRYGIDLNPASGRWNFDPGTGTFTRLEPLAPVTVQE